MAGLVLKFSYHTLQRFGWNIDIKNLMETQTLLII